MLIDQIRGRIEELLASTNRKERTETSLAIEHFHDQFDLRGERLYEELAHAADRRTDWERLVDSERERRQSY